MNERCIAMHTGLWAIEPTWFQLAFTALQLRGFHPIPMIPRSLEVQVPIEALTDDRRRSFQTAGKVAIVPVIGPMVKGESKFSEANMLRIQRQLADATADSEVDAIAVVGDSPGGTVAGTEETALAVQKASASKPVVVHIDDLGASAFMWLASQAHFVSANKTAMVGSLGTILQVIDSSKAHEAAGFTVHLVTSKGAKFKGAGGPGQAVTSDQLDYFQGLVDGLNASFKAAVRNGRGFSVSKTNSLFDGRIVQAPEAMSLGLIDGIMPIREAIANAGRNAAAGRKRRESATADKLALTATENRLRIEEQKRREAAANWN